MNGLHSGIRRFCTILVGLVFYIAGMLKLMDPVGAGLVMDEYFKFFHVGFMDFLARPAGVGMALLETLVGAALLAGVWRKWTALVTSLLTVGFTLLTLILVIFNPEMDCGCFGEAIHLTHFQTFAKNLVLCALCAAAFLPFRDFTPTRKAKVVAFAIAAVSAAALAIYSLGHQPIVDFTEFKVGTDLCEDEAAQVEEQVPQFTVIYSKDGVEQAFTLDELPDSTWTFVRQGEVTLNHDAEAPLLSISDARGEYREEMLKLGDVMAISIYDSKKYGSTEPAEDFLRMASMCGCTPVVISREYIDDLDSFTSDYKKVITLNRSNGGATLIRDGVITAKWTAGRLPDAQKLKDILAQTPEEVTARHITWGRIAFEGILIYSLALLLLL